MNPTDYLRNALGNDLEGVARLRLGRGVVGNTTYAFYATVVAIIAATGWLHSTPDEAVIADGGIGVFFLIYLFGTYLFAHFHPDLAMLGDSEWLALKQTEMASKGQPNIPVLPLSSDPSKPVIDATPLLEQLPDGKK